VCEETRQHGSGRDRRKRTRTTGTSPAVYFTVVVNGRGKGAGHASGAVLGASLTAGPAAAQTERPSSENALTAGSMTTMTLYVHVSGGRFTLDTLGGERAGVSSQALKTESALVAVRNTLLDRGPAFGSSRDGAVDAATATPADAAPGTTVTILPGVTLTVSSTGIQLILTKDAVTEVESVVGFGEDVASLVGEILDLAGVPFGNDIADIVASSLGLADSLLQLCTTSSGSATFTILWLGLPSCGGPPLTA
jgi:hypothetical protein